MALTWYGQKISAGITAAAILAVNETTEAAAEEARADHWWHVRSGHLEQETITAPARPSRGAVSGKFGTTRKRGFYGLFLEYKEPFLRPVADRVFPTLQARLAEKVREVRL